MSDRLPQLNRVSLCFLTHTIMAEETDVGILLAKIESLEDVINNKDGELAQVKDELALVKDELEPEKEKNRTLKSFEGQSRTQHEQQQMHNHEPNGFSSSLYIMIIFTS